MRLLIAMENGLLIGESRGDGFDTRLDSLVVLDDHATQCLAADPADTSRLYCGTFDAGLWRSSDAGRTWRQAPGLGSRQVTAVAVSSTERVDGTGVVFAGTEPSMVFRSEDGGDTWEECTALAALRSAREWSFPPRPHTHHVRWITPDPTQSGRLFVAIEAGALVRSRDGGRTWEDRVPNGPYDTHSLAATTLAPDYLRSAAGDGYFESLDGGVTWLQPEVGLEHRYLWSVAVDSRDPRLVMVSGASGPFSAHRATGAESYVYRRIDAERWQRLDEGLPDPQGTTVAVLASDPARSGVFYAANNHGAFQSEDRGETWVEIVTDWPDRFRSQRAATLLVLDRA